MTTALDSFRNPPDELALEINPLLAFTGGFTGGPPCNPQLDDIAGNNAFFQNLCAGSFNFNPAQQKQPGLAFKGRLFDTTGSAQALPANTWTRIIFNQWSTNSSFVGQSGPTYDRLVLPTFSLGADLLIITANLATTAAVDFKAGLIDNSGVIFPIFAMFTQAGAGSQGSGIFLAPSGSAYGLAVNPGATAANIQSQPWPTLEIFCMAQAS